jgi:hypothetical protein
MSAVALIAVGPPPVRADLIGNGDFETPGTSSGGYTSKTGGQTIGAWTVSGTNVLLLNTTYHESGITFNSHSGKNALDITGIGNTGSADGVTQSVATSVGTQYLLSFYVGRGDAGNDKTSGPIYANPATINLSINGGSNVSFTNSDVTQNAVNWKEFSYLFTATTSLTTISFLNGTPLNTKTNNVGSNYAGLDDVSLAAVPVPEPSTIVTVALVGLSLGVTRVARRRVSA